MTLRDFASGLVHRRTTPAPWDDDTGRPRVVVECDDFALAAAAENTLVDAGYHVRVCCGPDHLHRCPLLDAGRCELAAGSDVVVNLMQHDAASRDEILAALRTHHHDVPLVVEDAPLRGRSTAGDPGVHRLDAPVRRAALLTAVNAADQATPHPGG